MNKVEFIFECKKKMCCYSGFVNGDKRIRSIIFSDCLKKEKIEQLKKEYGIGGLSKPCRKYKCFHSGSWDRKGIAINYYDEKGIEKELKMGYNDIYRFLCEYYKVKE